MSVDLPAIVKDKPVTNILEALGYLPGVVNNNGMIGLAGASNVTIILNGELTNCHCRICISFYASHLLTDCKGRCVPDITICVIFPTFCQCGRWMPG